jgi:DNA polymerase I-like protein with 3'-5' exonuclease and polymerase domains
MDHPEDAGQGVHLMRFITLDFETYYDSDYTLQKMSTEDYVTDPRFEIILVGIKIGSGERYWVTGTKKQIGEHLYSLHLEECAVLGHNMSFFDALILAIHFGIVPAMILDTLCMAQALLKPFHRSISLDSCLKNLELGIHKGTAVHNMKGRTRLSLTKKELEDYGQYCIDDCEGTFRLFRHFLSAFPREELEIIDMTARMYIQPQFELDPNVLAENLAEVRAKKAQALNSLPGDVCQADLMSNPKFADVLHRYGVDVPTKISPTTGSITFAFAKTDTGWKELEEEWADDPVVSAILTARISAKSTLEESRSIRLLEIAKKYEKFRVPLRYYAAHPGRYGGMESINAQNFPRIDKSRMRFGVKAPKGYVTIAADLAQIEARIVAWLAGQKNLLEGFRNREDIYSTFATTAFGVETVKDRSPEDKKRRFVGKTCILGLGYGMGEAKLRATLRKDGVKLEPTETNKLVSVYRTVYSRIPMLWRHLDNHLGIMSSGAGRIKVGPVTLAKESIILPNGMAIVYNNLRQIHNEQYSGWVYNFAGETRTLWGGKVTENVVQALARILIMEYMLKIKHMLGLYPALQQHDELDYIVPAEYADKVSAVLGKIMRVPPSWAPDLPVEVEINYGPTLGHCK